LRLQARYVSLLRNEKDNAFRKPAICRKIN